MKNVQCSTGNIQQGFKMKLKCQFPVENSLLKIEHFNSTRVNARLRRAFTLIELLLVISILSILMGFLFTSLKAVRRYSREVSTRTELVHLEAAFLQYFNHYGYWPVHESYNENSDKEEDFVINEDIIEALSGKPGVDLNPDQIPFFEIVRKDSEKRAVNAWGDSFGGWYYVKFDFEGKNSIDFTELDEPIQRSVVVWTYHPDRKSETEFEKKVLGSWQQ